MLKAKEIGLILIICTHDDSPNIEVHNENRAYFDTPWQPADNRKGWPTKTSWIENKP